MRKPMPVENELKYILNLDCLEDIKSQLLTYPNARKLKIWQGYLTSHARIRHIEEGKTNRYVFTYKLKISGQTVEIETDISTHDFIKLVEGVDEKIVKERISIEMGEETWEVDFLKDAKYGEVYLIMAEVEMPEWQFVPSSIPEFVSDHLIFPVPKNDKRFNNKQLGLPGEVRKLYELVKNKSSK
jgi:CYTH domain-containing protein